MAFAKRTVVKGEGGKPHVMFVDTQTQEPIPYDQIENYDLIEHGDDLDIPEHKKKAQGGDEDSEIVPSKTDPRIWDGGTYDHDSSPWAPLTREDNYGYINKPALVSLLARAPGTLGLFGKAINVAINANNISAINAARRDLGLPLTSAPELAKGLLSDRQGHVADIVVGEKQYAIGLEELTKEGRTTLTPREAQNRMTIAELQNKEARIATPQETKAATKAFTSEFGRRADFTSPTGIAKGIVSKFLDKVKPTELDPVAPTPVGPSPTTPTPPAITTENTPSSNDVLEAIPVDPSEVLSPVEATPADSVQIDTQEPLKETPRAQPGKGLASLAPRGLNPTGRGRSQPVDPELTQAILNAVQSVLGPEAGIQVVSGTYDAAKQAAIDAKLEDLAKRGISPSSKKGQAELEKVGQVGSTRHNHGKAVDFDIVGPDGKKVLDRETLVKIAAELGKQGVQSLAGDVAGYMGRGRFHADFHSDRASSWAGTPKAIRDAFLSNRTPFPKLPTEVSQLPSGSPAGGPAGATGSGSPAAGTAADAFKAAVMGEAAEETSPVGELSFAPIPEVQTPQNNAVGNLPAPAPTPSPRPAPVQAAAPATGQGFLGATGTGGGLAGNNNPLGVEGGRGIPAEALPLMALTIAGELGSNTIQGIISGDERARETARKEIADIAATINNRAKSTRYANSPNPYGSVMTGSQYNSLLPGNLGTTKANLGLTKNFINQALNDFNSGQLTGNAPNSTHYYNASLVSPSWASYSKNQAVTTGEHTFVDPTRKNSTALEYQRALPTENIPTPTFNPVSLEKTFAAPIDREITKSALAPVAPNIAREEISKAFAAPVDRDITRSALAPVSIDQPLTPAEIQAIAQMNVEVVSPQEYAAAIAASQPNVMGFSNLSPTEALASYGVTTSQVGRDAGLQTGPNSYGAFGNAPGSGYGHSSMAGLPGMTDVSSYSSQPSGIAGTGIGYGHSAGSLSGTASGVGSGYGAAGGSTSYSGFMGADLGSYSSVSTSNATPGQFGGSKDNGYSGLGGFGEPGQLGDSRGGGFGSQSMAGVSTPGGTMSSATGMEAAAGSFGGLGIAGSLGGSASGLGSGLGTAGTSAGLGGSFSSGAETEATGTEAATSTATGTEAANDSAAAGTDSAASSGGDSSSSDSTSGEGAGAGGDKVICGYFYSKGRIPKKIYAGDLKYSKEISHERTKQGYLLWAIPVVKWLDKKPNRPIVDNILFPFTKGWVYEMAYRVGYTKERPLWGRVITPPLTAICYSIGFLKEKLCQKK